MAESRIEELRRRVRRDPGSRLFAQLAEEERKAGDLNEAIRIARAGLAVHPAYPAGLLTLGRALLEAGDGAGARAALQEALRAAPDNLVASRFLGQALEGVGELEGAVAQYRATLRLAPGDQEVAGRLEALSRTLARPEAVAPGAAAGNAPSAAVARVEPPQGESPPVAVNPVVGPGRGPDGDGAAPARLEAASGALAEGDAPPFSSPTLAELYLRQGFAERAVEVYRQVGAEHPGDERARMRLTEIASRLGVASAGGAVDEQAVRRRALQRTIAGLEVLLGVARRR